jgi:tetratricopeptide (TPR) repeat protein
VETGSFGTERLQRRKKEGIRKRKGQEASVISLGRDKIIDKEYFNKAPLEARVKTFQFRWRKHPEPRKVAPAMKPAVFSFGLPVLVLTLLFAAPLRAQDTTEQVKKILDSYQGGKFEEVVKLANEFIQAKPQDPNLPSAYLLLARSYYNLGKWTDAVPAYRKVQTVSTEKDVKEEAGYCLAQSLAAQAEASPEKSPDRKKYLEEAIQLTGEFGKTFPDSKSLAEILLLQARLHVQQGKYAEASKDLDAARKADTEKNLGEELDYLQGFAEAQRARELLAEFKKADGEAAVARASQIYARLASAGNPALATEATLQLANLDMAAGRYSERSLVARNSWPDWKQNSPRSGPRLPLKAPRLRKNSGECRKLNRK